MGDRILYKATRLDGTDFKTGTIDYAAALASGQPVTWAMTGKKGHMIKNEPGTYFSLSSEPGEVLTGGQWPCRLFRVEAHGRTISHSQMAFKVCCHGLGVVEELPAHLALGPNGEECAAFIEEVRGWSAAWYAAGDAARAIIVRDLISADQFIILSRPCQEFRRVMDEHMAGMS